MSALDVIVIVVAIAAVAYGARIYWRSRAEREEQLSAALVSEHPPAPPPPLPLRARKESPSGRTLEASSGPELPQLTPSERNLEAEVAALFERQSSPDLAAAAFAAPEAAPPKLYADEDDESLDPTKIGPLPTALRDGDDDDDEDPGLPTVERLFHDPETNAEEPPRAQPAFAVLAVGQTDTGLRRENNEDAMLVLEKEGLFAVADGMGGHRAGEQASKLAVMVLEEAFTKGAPVPERDDVPPSAKALVHAVDLANRAIRAEARRNKKLEGMGTTICAARFVPEAGRLYVAHVGDSRCYRMRDGVLAQMTVDHTMADLGVKGPEGSHLSRALGPFATVPIDLVVARPEIADLYLICSDGLTKMLGDEAIATVLRHETDLKAAVERLVLFAKGHGGKDNITIVLARVAAPPGQRRMKQTLVGVG